MKKCKTIIIILFVLCMVLPMLFSCDSNNIPEDTTINTETETTTEKIVIQEPEKGTEIHITYRVSIESVASIIGEAEQVISYGETASTPVLIDNFATGFSFKCWSDGCMSALRSDDSPMEDTVYTAYVEVDAKEMPILIISTENSRAITSKTEYMKGTVSLCNAAEEYCFENLSMKIRGRGNYTWGSTFNQPAEIWNKKPYRIKLDKSKNVLGLGNGKTKDWVLLADHCDKSLLHNYIVYQFARSLSGFQWQPNCMSVEVWLNGEYIGVYLLAEQIEVDKDRINISEDVESSAQIDFLTQMSHKGDEPAKTNSIPGANQVFEVKSDLSTNSSLAAQQLEYVRSCVQACWDATLEGDEATICELMDMDSVIDVYLTHEYFKQLDVAADNFFMYKTVNGKLTFGPVWDFDQCGGNANIGTETYENLWATNNNWFANFMKLSWFREAVKDRWNEISDLVNQVPAVIRAKGQELNNSFNRNFDKWKILHTRINRETDPVLALKNYDENNEYFAKWMENRANWLNNYFNSQAFLKNYGK